MKLSIPLSGRADGEYCHIRKCYTFPEILFALSDNGILQKYLLAGHLPMEIELREWLQKYPVPYKFPDRKYVQQSLPVYFDVGILGQPNLVDEDPHRLEVFLPIVLEYFKFTGKRLFPETFGQKSFDHFFAPFKGEYKKRRKELKRIIDDYLKASKGIPDPTSKALQERIDEVRKEIKPFVEEMK